MQENVQVSIVIVTYNAMKWAEKCFSSLRNSSIPVDVIVIDNGSTDGTQDFVKAQFPEVTFIQSPENLGFGKANNQGIEIAYQRKADFVYLLNQDTWLYHDTIEQMLKVYNSYPNKTEIGILSPFHLDGSEKKLDIFLDKYISHSFETTRMISDLYLNLKKNFYEIGFINAAHWFIPILTIEEIGGFNPYFFHYGEDNEYVNRIHFHQKKILLCSHSKAVHDGKQDLKKVNYSKFKNLTLETKIMNPSYENSWEKEKKALRQSIIKDVFTGKLNFAKSKYQKYKKLKSEAQELLRLKKQVSNKGASFLQLK